MAGAGIGERAFSADTRRGRGAKRAVVRIARGAVVRGRGARALWILRRRAVARSVRTLADDELARHQSASAARLREIELGTFLRRGIARHAVSNVAVAERRARVADLTGRAARC